MKRYRLTGRHELTFDQDCPEPRPGPGQVLVRVGACTVCNRSDLAYYHYYGLREHCSQGCFGHEIAGTVAETGPGVSTVRPGQRVFVRTPLTTGYAEYALAREIAVGPLPDETPVERGAILQLLPLAVHATRGVRLGDRVAVLGQGPVGLMALQVARLRGAAETVSVDLDPWRLERAEELGTDRTVQLTEGKEDWQSVGADFDVAIDAAGTPHTANACVGLLRQNGLMVLLGTHHVDTRVTFDLVAWERKGLRVHTSAEPTDTARAEAMATALRLIPRIALGPLLTASYPLERLPEALVRLSDSSLLRPAAERGPHPGPPERTLKLAITP